MTDTPAGNENREIEKIYSPEGLRERLTRVLMKAGADIENLKPEDLALIEDMHLRGRDGTKELISLLELKNGRQLIDLGSGIGGTCRFIASEYKCKVTGVDLSEEFCSTADFLTKMTGLHEYIRFIKADVTEIPLEDNSFDFAVSQHVQMNVRDKKKFLSEVHRVLKPGGSFAFHDIFTNGRSSPYYPVPWADKAEISFLETWQNYRTLLEKAGFTMQSEKDVSEATRSWFRVMFEKTKARGEFPEHSRIIIGEDAEEKMRNVFRSLEEGLISIVQAVFRKSL